MYVDIYEKINSTSVHCNVPIYRYHIFRVYEVTGKRNQRLEMLDNFKSGLFERSYKQC